MKEYFKNPEATQDSFIDDWLRTGDLGRMDQDGFIFVTGRLKELITMLHVRSMRHFTNTPT